MGQRDPQVFVRIHWNVVDSDFVVKVRTGAASAQAHVADRISAVDMLSGSYREVRQMPVPSGDAMAVIEGDGPAVSAEKICKSNDTVCRSDDRLPHIG